MTYSTAEINSPSSSAIPSEDDVRAAGVTTADELLRQALDLLGQRLLTGGEFDAAVEDYERRVAGGQPYEDTVDREELRRRYGV